MTDCQSQARGKVGEHMRSGGWITGYGQGATRVHAAAGLFGVPPLLLPHSAETWRHSASTHHGGAAAVQPRVEA